MLKQRIITAIILAAIFISALVGLSPLYFSLFIGAVVLIGAWEWARLSNPNTHAQPVLYSLVVALIMVGLGWGMGLQVEGLASPLSSLGSQGSSGLLTLKVVLIAGCAWWLLALVLVKAYPSGSASWGHPAVCLLLGFLVLIPTWAALVYVRFQPQGAWLILMIVGVVAAADTGGYFTGRKFGKRKLAPEVSPGKTLEGFVGGLASNILLAVLIAWLSDSRLLPLIAIIIPTSLFSVLGDLVESMVKRHAGVKDSGRILPGHGGILDRVDSITAAAPIFALALIVSGWTPGG